MNTKNVARRMASKLQRTLMALLVLVVLFGSMPIRMAQAGSGAAFSDVYCKQGFYNHTISVQGAYNNQSVAYRFREYDLRNGAWVLKLTSNWRYVTATTNLIMHIDQVFVPATKGTTIHVQTEVWYWNNVTRRYEGPIYRLASHHDYFNTGSWDRCLIW
jgi:hypothetical protein